MNATADAEIEAAMAAALANSGGDGGDPLAFLDGIGETAAASGKRKTYPMFPDPDGTAAGLAQKIVDLADAADQLTATNKLLGEHVTPFYFKNCAGRAEFESSVKVTSPGGNVLVTFKAQAKKMKDDSAAKQVAHILGVNQKNLFRHTFDLKIDGDEIPATAVAAVVRELKVLFAKHGCAKALKVEKKFEPFPSFHSQRHVLFTPEQNLEIHRAIPVITAVKTKDVV